jgi:hypothetical protein
VSLWRRRHTVVELYSDRMAATLFVGNALARRTQVRWDIHPSEPNLEGMGDLLRNLGGPIGRLQLVLSDHFVRYLTVERLPGLRSLGELHSTLAALFEVRFGQSAGGWQIEFDLSPAHALGLACAAPRALIAQVVQQAREAGAKSTSIQPWFVAAMARHCSGKLTSNWIAGRSDGQVTLALLTPQGWRHIRTFAASPDASLQQLVDREVLLTGLELALPLVTLPSGDEIAGVGDSVTHRIVGVGA